MSSKYVLRQSHAINYDANRRRFIADTNIDLDLGLRFRFVGLASTESFRPIV